MIITDLRNHPEHLEPLAAWYHQEWAHLGDYRDLAHRCESLQAHLADAMIPTTFIALDGDTLLGGLCLVTHDIEARPDLSPWVSRIYVHHNWRGKAIGTQLIEHAITFAQSHGFDGLYLLTEHRQAWFAQFGWQAVETAQLNQHPVHIMRRDLSGSG